MNRSELRRAMRQKKAELKAAMRRARKEQRARLEQNPVFRKRRRRRRIRNGIAAALAVLFVLLWRCDCAKPPPPAPVVEKQEVKKEPPPPPPLVKPGVKPKKKLEAEMASKLRGSYGGEERAAPSWVDDFRLQVAARSVRLASCFTGIDKPGALRWTASVNPESGAVSDHELEALASTMPIWPREKTCLIGALSNPPYKISGAPPVKEGIPNRVSIVIEF